MQPATFLVQLAQALVLMKDYNVNVSAVVGHSLGEVVAEIVAGSITTKAGVTLTLERTKACLDIEAERGLHEEMGMVLCIGVDRETAEHTLSRSTKTRSL